MAWKRSPVRFWYGPPEKCGGGFISRQIFLMDLQMNFVVRLLPKANARGSAANVVSEQALILVRSTKVIITNRKPPHAAGASFRSFPFFILRLYRLRQSLTV